MGYDEIVSKSLNSRDISEMDDNEILMDESLYDEVNRKDANQVLLVELLHLLSSSLKSDPTTGIVEFESQEREEPGLIGRPFQNLTITLKKLATIPGNDGHVLIRARVPSAQVKASGLSDYEVRFSELVVDKPALVGMIERIGERMGYLIGLMERAFDIFSSLNISCLYIRMPENTTDAYNNLKASLQILSQYNKSLEEDKPLRISIDGTEKLLPVVSNESGQPDVNLTLLAGLNDIPPQTMGNLVREISDWMRTSDASTGAHRYASVYNAISSTQGDSQKFKTPPIEVNNVKWLLMDKGGQKLSKAKAQLARILQEMPDPSPLHQIRRIQSLYGMDYPLISPLELAYRLQCISEIAAAAGNRPKRQLILEEILTNLQWRMDKVSDEVYREIELDGNRLQFMGDNDEDPISVELKSQNIVRFFSFFKRRSITRKKMRRIGDRELSFDSIDFEIIAREFDISPVDARDILDVVKQCFDNAGHFVKGAFESSLEKLSQFESKAFEILWHYLKEPLDREDRLAFLNAVQLFFVRLKHPDKALEILLDDFISECQLVRYSDRNAMMLATLLLRRYNKELDIDIEITPEEVFMVQDGLNRDVATTALLFLDTHKQALFEKIRTIHRKVFESMDPATTELMGMTSKYMLSLEREVHIFLALLGGDIARSILRGALNAYGNPSNELYRLAASDRLRQALIQHLKVLLRGLGRAGDASDMPSIEQILNQKGEFFQLSKEPRYTMLVERTMDYAERAVTEMTDRGRITATAS